MNLKVLLDMDGVLADFVGGMCSAHNKPNPYTDPQSYGQFDMERLWGMPPNQFWAKAEEWEFWSNLPKTPEADEIVRMATAGFGIENVAVLTAPPLAMGSVSGKRIWMKQHFPQLSKRMIFASAKEFISAPGRVLIDDKCENIDGWNREGGYGILVPRLWNRRYREANSDIIGIIRRELSTFYEEHNTLKLPEICNC